MSDASDGRARLGYGLGKDEGEAFWVFGMLETIKISAADTDGRYGLVEVVARAGDGPAGTSTMRRTSGSTPSRAPGPSTSATSG